MTTFWHPKSITFDTPKLTFLSHHKIQIWDLRNENWDLWKITLTISKVSKIEIWDSKIGRSVGPFEVNGKRQNRSLFWMKGFRERGKMKNQKHVCEKNEKSIHRGGYWIFWTFWNVIWLGGFWDLEDLPKLTFRTSPWHHFLMSKITHFDIIFWHHFLTSKTHHFWHRKRSLFWHHFLTSFLTSKNTSFFDLKNTSFFDIIFWPQKHIIFWPQKHIIFWPQKHIIFDLQNDHFFDLQNDHFFDFQNVAIFYPRRVS